MTQIVKNLPAMQETQIWSLGWEDPREKDIDDNTDNAYLPRAASLVAQRLKRLPAMWETWVRSLGQEDPLEKEMATHSSVLAWKIPWTEEPGGLQSTGAQRVGHDWETSLSLSRDTKISCRCCGVNEQGDWFLLTFCLFLTLFRDSAVVGNQRKLSWGKCFQGSICEKGSHW